MVLTRRTFSLGAASLAGAACAGSPPANAVEAAPKGASLDAIARKRGLRFGSAIKSEQLLSRDITDVFNRECGVVVAENDFKWRSIERKPGAFSFEKADAVAKFATDNNHLLRGHTLCWNQDNRMPDWLIKAEPYLGPDKTKQATKVLIDYILRLTARYPQVASWDVVNESILLRDGSIRESFLTRTIGPDFGLIAFETAKQAAPNAELVYNDYMSWDKKPHHRTGVLKYLEGLLKNKAPIDALGIQSHLANTVADHDEKAWRAFLTEIEGMGLKVLITELDCGDRDIADADIAKRDADTAAHIKAYLDITLSFKNVKQVIAWGMTDRDSYTNAKTYPEERRRPDGLPQRPHPYDDAMRPKPIRTAIAAALSAAPAR